MRNLTPVLIAAVVLALALASSASASELITRNASNVTLKVDDRGRALLSYNLRGVRRHTVVWGAINARHPSRSVRQVKFKVDYSGGWGAFRQRLWLTMKNRCRPYDGPRLPWFVTACKAPDGSYWAVQRFQRLRPNLGIDPWLPKHRAQELHLSHWKGPLAVLEAYNDWVYGNQAHETFGRLSYRGRPVHGFSASAVGEPLDSYGRLIFLDVYNAKNPVYRRGWIRENSFLARKFAGFWCYHYVSRDRYAGYPAGPRRPAANGERYRLTAKGPGVTPIVMTTLQGLPDYDRSNPAHVAHEQAMNDLRRRLAGAGQCTTN